MRAKKYFKSGNLALIERSGRSHDDVDWVRQEWYRDGHLQRETYYRGDLMISGHWYKDGHRHREDGPAWVMNRYDGTPSSRAWYLDGKLHREDGPAVIGYNEDGTTKERWYTNGVPKKYDLKH